MTIPNLSFNGYSNASIGFPHCVLPQTYGTSLFWAEEYWTVIKIQELKKKYPYINFSGLIDSYFMKSFHTLLKSSTHERIFGTKSFKDISEIGWEDNRHLINIATSHAPSRYIALDYWEKFGDDFGIITIDAHLDLSDSQKMHGAWITKELASITTVIGGWADTSHDIENATSLFAFIEPNVKKLISSHGLHAWLRGKKIYLSIDLDYYRLSHTAFLGYSNYWHRNKIIGHSMNIEQMFKEKNFENHSNTPLLLGKYLHFFPNLETFEKNKKISLKNQSNEIFATLREIVLLCHKNSANVLSIDFVEYSPACDWQQLTIKEFMGNFPKYSAIIG
ncbi:MAG: hypothetical protein JSU57_04445 [Candidatus Heimdallarchaeota archaeon]|nr:MAG: hypothetical protein JSU57_04445 [Candidatus Heimdallarchaeota archaeon]